MTTAEKAKKYDEIEAIVAAFYVDEEGNEVEEDERGLEAIGEAVATYLGYL